MEKQDSENKETTQNTTSQNKETLSESIKKKAENIKKKVSKKTPEEKIKELEEQLEEMKNDYLRARADFENFRKRKEQEIAEIRDRAISSFVVELLPAIDNFEMALKMTDNKEMFIKGVEMIHKNLMDTLKEHHFEEYVPQVGEEFNPQLHEPLLIESEEHKPGTIVNVLQKGFLKKEKVIRPARVQVAKEKEEPQESNTEEHNDTKE
jgi:molecular chaperone GrpE